MTDNIDNRSVAYRLDSSKVLWSIKRYIGAFENDKSMLPDNITVPGPSDESLVPWLVEAPFSSVEILEAILKPETPFQIHTARHIHRGQRTSVPSPTMLSKHRIRFLRMQQRLYREYTRLQGRLEMDREISFVCIAENDIWRIRDTVSGICRPVKLFYISIPWFNGQETTFEHPWALVMNDGSFSRCFRSPEYLLNALLRRINIANCVFQRSLLKPGTVPLPECLADWFVGVAGTNVALPYYEKASDEGNHGDGGTGDGGAGHATCDGEADGVMERMVIHMQLGLSS